MTTRVVRSRDFPVATRFGPGAVLLYDRSLSRRVPGFAAWSRTFPHRVAVAAGESLKDADRFGDHIEPIVRATTGRARSEAVLVCAGGGSVGDFGGFAASVIQRGIRLVHVPTTWLAAVDSAHGGKTALNVGGRKNSIGTFYPAERVCLVRRVLDALPDPRAREGIAEMVKIALLDGGAWAKRFLASEDPRDVLLWRHLAAAIDAKQRVVDEDARETSGHRQILNFGHTVGHVIEAHDGVPHGRAITQGLYFALAWSCRRAWLTEADHRRFAAALARLTGDRMTGPRAPIPRARFVSLLAADKKAAGAARVTFVFLHALGSPTRRRVPIEAVADEAAFLGWVR